MENLINSRMNLINLSHHLNNLNLNYEIKKN